jgi:hypothetical protein
MDNFAIDITCQGRKNLELAIQIAFSFHSKAVAFRIHPEKGLILYWAAAANSTPLAYPTDAAGAAVLVWGWLTTEGGSASKRQEPDHDGSNGDGWRVYNEGWGHVDGQYQAFVAITHAWAMYGK